MELFTLNSEFQLDHPVEKYASLLWAERYSKSGDITIVSHNISELTEILPEGTVVGLRDSTVPMIIETIKPTKPRKGLPAVEIKGRSFESVLDRRGSVNTPDPGDKRVPWMISAAKESDAAYLAMRVVLSDGPRYPTVGAMLAPIATPAASPYDAIEEIDLILPADFQQTPPATAYEYEIKPGNLYNTMLELINTNRRGLKAVRPDEGGTKIGIEIYNGANLTGEGDNSDVNNVVVFDAKFDQFEDATYLLSKQGSANVGYIYGFDGFSAVLKNNTTEPYGLNRRVLVLDLSSDNSTSGATVGESNRIRQTRGIIELYKYNATALFEGKIAEQVSIGYNKDYFLGDILKLVGEFGLSQNVRVTEFIRSSDATGIKAFPAFEAIDD